MPIFDKEKREERKVQKDKELGQQIKQESGIDPSKYSAPMTEESKRNITEGLTQGVSDKLKADVKGFESTYKTPEYQQPTLNTESLKRKARQEKREKYFDVLRAIGAGFQGKDVQSSLMAPKLEAERQAQYQQYKDIVKANKARHEEFQSGYRDDLLNFIQGKLKDKDTSEMDRLKLQKLQSEIENIQARTKWQKDKPYYKPDQKSALEDQKLQAEIKNIQARTDYYKNKGLQDKDKEKANEDLQFLTQRLQDAQLKLDKMDEENQGTSWYEWFDSARRKSLQSQVEDLKSQKTELQSIIGSNKSPIQLQQDTSESIDPWDL